MKTILAFATTHKEALVLLGLAGINNLSETLPPSLVRFTTLAWVYDWFHGTVKTFASTRGPKA